MKVQTSKQAKNKNRIRKTKSNKYISKRKTSNKIKSHKSSNHAVMRLQIEKLKSITNKSLVSVKDDKKSSTGYIAAAIKNKRRPTTVSDIFNNSKGQDNELLISKVFSFIKKSSAVLIQVVDHHKDQNNITDSGTKDKEPAKTAKVFLRGSRLPIKLIIKPPKPELSVEDVTERLTSVLKLSHPKTAENPNPIKKNVKFDLSHLDQNKSSPSSIQESQLTKAPDHHQNPASMMTRRCRKQMQSLDHDEKSATKELKIVYKQRHNKRVKVTREAVTVSNPQFTNIHEEENPASQRKTATRTQFTTSHHDERQKGSSPQPASVIKRGKRQRRRSRCMSCEVPH